MKNQEKTKSKSTDKTKRISPLIQSQTRSLQIRASSNCLRIPLRCPAQKESHRNRNSNDHLETENLNDGQL